MHNMTFRSKVAVLWDLDGTLVDVEALSTRAVNSVLATLSDRRVESELEAKTLGLRPSEWTRLVIDELGLQGRIAPEQLHARTENELFKLLPMCELLPGADAVTAALAAKGIPQAIATSSVAAAVEMKRQRHGLLFSRMACVVTGDEVAKGKPEPDIFLAAAARLGVPASSCVVVEDSLNGIRAGVAAGCRVVAVPAPGSDVAAFLAAGAAVVVPSLNDWDWAADLRSASAVDDEGDAGSASRSSSGAGAMP